LAKGRKRRKNKTQPSDASKGVEGAVELASELPTPAIAF
jgi:hypothetical protein